MALLELQSIEKEFPGVKALDDICMVLEKGEVHALLGENGAGKSTLIKILGGVYAPDAGKILLNNNPIEVSNPAESKELGIGIIFQELNIVHGLSVRDNLFLGSERNFGLIDESFEKHRAKEILNDLEANFSLNQICGKLSIAQQQLVEIAKALLLDVKVLVMDEPTASLTARDVENLYKIVLRLKDQGIGIIYVSHKLEEIEYLADRVTILRDGKHVITGPKHSFTRKSLIEHMVGRELDNEFPVHKSTPGPDVLEVEDLGDGRYVNNVNLSLRKGEILGLAGLVGAGRTELVRLIAGSDRVKNGKVRHKGKVAVIRSPKDAINQNIGLLPEDRKNQGLIINHSVYDNFGLVNLQEFSKNGWVLDRQLYRNMQQHKERLSIKFSHSNQKVRDLSGGNQQKIVIAKWLEKSCDIFIFDEPTRGIDVGAKYEIYELMFRLLEQGKSIIMVSSELPELLGISDRIIVMKNGQIVGHFDDAGRVKQEEVMQLCF